MDMKSQEMYAPAEAPVIAGARNGLLNEEIEQCFCNDGPEVSEDEWLVQGCLRGDQQAWGELIDKYKRLIYSIPIKYGASPADASDVFQAVCIEFLQLLFFQQPPLPYAEVARRMGLATGSIGFIRGRCLEKLRKALVEFGFNG